MLDRNTKVFGLGLSRTGTSSLGRALNEIGIKTIHYPHDETTHAELLSGSGKLSILKRYDGIVDISTVPFYHQLDNNYPGSKFILTVRDKKSWLKSINDHIERIKRSSPYLNDQFIKFTKYIMERVYKSSEYDEELLSTVYDQHLTDVTKYFRNRPKDLLILDLFSGDGWKQLCGFLECGLLTKPFPHANKDKPADKYFESIKIITSDINSTIPAGSSLIFVDQAAIISMVEFNNRNVIPFLERDGKYWGKPSDDAAAIEEIDRQREVGVRFIVFAWPAFWWLDYYLEFNSYLQSEFKRIMSNDRVIVFELKPDAEI